MDEKSNAPWYLKECARSLKPGAYASPSPGCSRPSLSSSEYTRPRPMVTAGEYICCCFGSVRASSVLVMCPRETEDIERTHLGALKQLGMCRSYASIICYRRWDWWILSFLTGWWRSSRCLCCIATPKHAARRDDRSCPSASLAASLCRYWVSRRWEYWR